MAFLLEENAKTMSRIRTARYHIEQTETAPTKSPDVRHFAADVVRQGTNVWSDYTFSAMDVKTGQLDPLRAIVVKSDKSATVWYVGTAQATSYQVDDNGAFPEAVLDTVRHSQPFDIYLAVTGNGMRSLSAMVTDFRNKSGVSVAASREPITQDKFDITVYVPTRFPGPAIQFVLDANKGFLVTSVTGYFAPNVVGDAAHTVVAQVGRDHVWFPIFYEHTAYDPQNPRTTKLHDTARLSQVVLNQDVSPDTFQIANLGLPDGTKVGVRPVAEDERLMLWFRGTLISQDAFIALNSAIHKTETTISAVPGRSGHGQRSQRQQLGHWSGLILIFASLGIFAIVVIIARVRAETGGRG